MSDERDLAVRFMEALWAGDERSCGELMTADAVWQLQPGMPQAERCQATVRPARETLARIIADLFGRFDPEGFSVTLTRAIAEGEAVALEYRAEGRTVTGDRYANIYCTVLIIRGRKIAEVRPYNDTWYMRRTLHLDQAG